MTRAACASSAGGNGMPNFFDHWKLVAERQEDMKALLANKTFCADPAAKQYVENLFGLVP